MKYVIWEEYNDYIGYANSIPEAMELFDKVTALYNLKHGVDLEEPYLTCAEMGITEDNFETEMVHGTDAIWVDLFEDWVEGSNEIINDDYKWKIAKKEDE